MERIAPVRGQFTTSRGNAAHEMGTARTNRENRARTGNRKLGTGVNEGDSAVVSRRRTPRTARPSRGQVNPELVGRGLLPCLAAKREAFPQGLSQRLHLCLRLRLVDMIDPVGRRRNGPGGEPAAMARMPAMPEPGPSPVFGSFNQVCPQRVSLDVAADRQKMLVGLDRKRLESSLVERPRAERAMRMVPAHRVRHGQPMHEPRKVAIGLRPEDKMPVVWHQAKCQQPHRRQHAGTQQEVLEGRIVGGVMKDRRSTDGAVEHVADRAERVHAFMSWHAQ